jgi:hypothetical protein
MDCALGLSSSPYQTHAAERCESYCCTLLWQEWGMQLMMKRTAKSGATKLAS